MTISCSSIWCSLNEPVAGLVDFVAADVVDYLVGEHLHQLVGHEHPRAAVAPPSWTHRAVHVAALRALRAIQGCIDGGNTAFIRAPVQSSQARLTSSCSIALDQDSRKSTCSRKCAHKLAFGPE